MENIQLLLIGVFMLFLTATLCVGWQNLYPYMNVSQGGENSVVWARSFTPLDRQSRFQAWMHVSSNAYLHPDTPNYHLVTWKTGSVWCNTFSYRLFLAFVYSEKFVCKCICYRESGIWSHLSLCLASYGLISLKLFFLSKRKSKAFERKEGVGEDHYNL